MDPDQCCAKCERPLFTIGKYFEDEDGKKKCAPCMDDLYSKTCLRCSKEIQQYTGGDKMVSSSDKSKHWHSTCFTCSTCNRSLAGVSYVPGKTAEMLYCSECYDNNNSTTCIKCQEKIMKHSKGHKEILSSDGSKHWHDRCFKCEKCEKSLVGLGYYPSNKPGKEDMLFCEACVKTI